jgi:hypothetical protein
MLSCGLIISTMVSSDFSSGILQDFTFRLIPSLRWFCASDQMRPLLFHRLLSQHPALPTPESSSRLLFRFFTASVAFAMRDRLGSLLFPFRG